MRVDPATRGVAPAGVRIRKALRGDAEALLALYCEVHDAHVAAMPEDFAALSPEAEARLLEGFLGDGGQCIHVAETDKGLLGCVRFQERGRAGRRHVYIDMLVVSPRWQSRGVGQALLQQVYDHAAARDCTEITLDVYEFNTAGLRLYERMGYRTVSRRLRLRLAADETLGSPRR